MLYINSPGGMVTAGMAIYDTMQYVRPDVATFCMGQAASMGAFLLAAGAKGKRYSLPHARILIHQPLGGFSGQATDIDIHASEILRHARQAERAAGQAHRPADRAHQVRHRARLLHERRSRPRSTASSTRCSCRSAGKATGRLESVSANRRGRTSNHPTTFEAALLVAARASAATARCTASTAQPLPGYVRILRLQTWPSPRPTFRREVD